MKYKRIGNSYTMIPEIGLGVWRYDGGVEPLRMGIGLGASLIDTAEGYGTEQIVGEAIKGISSEVFVATKVSGRHLHYDEVLRAAERSIKTLGVEYIDLYQVHWPSASAPLGETMEAMEKLADMGMIRFIGVSNFSVGELRQAMNIMRNYPIVSNQVLYNLNERGIEGDLLSFCLGNDITVIAYTPLDNGSLADNTGRAKGQGMEVLTRIAEELGRTPAQVALNWCISHPNVVAIPKSNSVERTAENCAASGWDLSSEHMELLDDVFWSGHLIDNVSR